MTYLMNHVSKINVFVVVLGFILITGCSESQNNHDNAKEKTTASVHDTAVIDVWNGSRTSARRAHEREVLEAELESTEDEYGLWKLKEHTEDYHGDRE